MKKMQKGFTLIELMIVVAVIGVLAAIAIPQYQDYMKKGGLGSALSTANGLKTNVEDYIAREGVFPPTLQDINAPTFTLGKLAVTTGAEGAGDLQVTLDSTSAAGGVIKLKRDKTGAWTCEHSGPHAASIKLTGCPSV